MMPHLRLGIFAAAALSALPVAFLGAAAVTEENLNPGPPGPVSEVHSAERVVHPGDPGPNLPWVGRSVFDLLFTSDGVDGRVYDVPFPFIRVIDRIKSQLPPDDQSGFSSLKTALIPIGRSLQRNDAAPNFFRYPRIVIAVDTESRGPLYLKDRLFIGYQEKSNRLEVISYNEAAGRFEFQIVNDYAPGRNPKVKYAERAVCISCHQNGAPIFSEAPWSETNFGPVITDQLLQHNTHHHGVPVESAGGAAFIDGASNRANLFSAYQLLWREACADDVSPIRARRCRAGALVAMLQLRLGAFSRFDDQAILYRDDLVPVSNRQWQQRWPAGLSIPNADIPNRRPSLEAVSADVPTRIDPLTARPPGANWSVNTILNRMIAGLSGFISGHDIARLDDHLFEWGKRGGALHEDFSGTCQFTQQGTRTKQRPVNFECRLLGTISDQGFDLVGDVVFEPDWRLSPTINWLTLGSRTGFAGLTLSGGPIQVDHDRWSVKLDLYQRQNGLRARLSDGNALVALRLSWPNISDGRFPFSDQGVTGGSATLTVMQDFSRVYDAIAGMLAQSDDQPEQLFSSEVFQGTRVMTGIFAELGIDANEHCCAASQMPPPEVDDMDTMGGVRANLAHGDALETFYHFCGTCHQADAKLPPGFLFGADANQISANLRQCAPRILFRLQMWEMNDERPKSPMPPLSRLQSFKYSPVDWRQSPELERMKQHASQLMGGKQGRIPGSPELLDTQYADLPPCLP